MTAIEKMTQSANEKMECKWKNHIEKSYLEIGSNPPGMI